MRSARPAPRTACGRNRRSRARSAGGSFRRRPASTARSAAVRRVAARRARRTARGMATVPAKAGQERGARLVPHRNQRCPLQQPPVAFGQLGIAHRPDPLEGAEAEVERRRPRRQQRVDQRRRHRPRPLRRPSEDGQIDRIHVEAGVPRVVVVGHRLLDRAMELRHPRRRRLGASRGSRGQTAQRVERGVAVCTTGTKGPSDSSSSRRMPKSTKSSPGLYIRVVENSTMGDRIRTVWEPRTNPQVRNRG